MHIASPVVEKAFLSRLSYRCNSASTAASCFFPSVEGKVNFYHFGLTKCAIYCKKCFCFCSYFSLCCYYSHVCDGYKPSQLQYYLSCKVQVLVFQKLESCQRTDKGMQSVLERYKGPPDLRKLCFDHI